MKYFAILAFVVLVAACSNSTTSFNNPPGSITGLDTIIADNFISSGQPSLEGWRYYYNGSLSKDSSNAPNVFITTQFDSSADVPWSIFLMQSPIRALISTDLVDLSSGVYAFSVRAKDSLNAGGSFYIQHRVPQWHTTATMAITNSNWKLLTLYDTVSQVANDTIRLLLSGGQSNAPRGMTLFHSVIYGQVR